MRKLFLLSLQGILAFTLAAQIPSGYYATLLGKQTASLKTELHTIICQDTTHYLTYGSGTNHTWQGFYSTDRDEKTNLVIDMYSDSLRYFPTNYVSSRYPGFGQKIHIEHSVPKSWWRCDIDHPDCAAEDLNHLYPADGTTNSSKNDNPLGIVSGTPTKSNGVSKIGPAVYEDYVGNVFEPADQFKGDFARSYFYMATAYEHYVNKWDTTKPENMMQSNTYPTLKPWAVQLLLQWHRQDPVSEKERIRVEKVFKIQKNRNPFIDYPELVEYIWGTLKDKPWGVIAGAGDLKLQFSITLSPLHDTLNIDTNEKELTCTVFSLNGQQMMKRKLNGSDSFSVQMLDNGMYFIQLQSGNKRATHKFTINR